MTPSELKRSFQPAHLRGVNADQRTVDIVASDFSLDSYGTRIDPAGWDLEQFKRNPVICLQHDSYCGLPVAQALPETVRVENNKLLMTVQFPPAGVSDDADEAFGLIAAGVLRGVSVGFDAQKWEQVNETQPDGSSLNVLIFREQMLREVSFVTIPSNDNGLVVRSREQGHDPEKMIEMTRKLEASLKEEMVSVRKADWELYEGYFTRKQPANKESTRVLKRFFEARGEEQPDEEVLAWKRMGELLDEKPEVKTEEKVEEKPVEAPAEEKVTEQQTVEPEVKAEEPAPAADKPTEPTAPAPAAPEPERAALVQIPLSVLTEMPAKLARTYVETAAAALRRGVPRKDVAKLIDGANDTVTKSLFTLTPHGEH
jgi:HK97 family phage prohead protease